MNKGRGTNGTVPVNPEAHVPVDVAGHIMYHNGKCSKGEGVTVLKGRVYAMMALM